MAELKIGYARVSTVDQDLTVQREALAALGVEPKRIYVDHGLTGTDVVVASARTATSRQACNGPRLAATSRAGF